MASTAEDDRVITQRMVSKETAFTVPCIDTIAKEWAQAVAALSRGGAPSEKARAAIEATLVQTRQFGLDVARNAHMSRASAAELAQCDDMQARAEADIARVTEEIAALKGALARARAARRQRAEYEELSRAANALPPCRAAEAETAALQAKMEAGAAERRRVDAAIALRERQFQLLLQTIFELQSALAEGDPTSVADALEGGDGDGDDANDEEGGGGGGGAGGGGGGGGGGGESEEEDGGGGGRGGGKRKRRASEDDEGGDS